MVKAFQYYKQHFVIILYIVVFIVCFGLAVLLMSQGTSKKIRLPFNNQPAQQSLTDVSTSQQPTSGARMILATADGKQSYSSS